MADHKYEYYVYSSIYAISIQWNPLNTELKGLMKSVHVIRISTYQKLGILEALQGPFSAFMLSKLLLSRFHCSSNTAKIYN